MVFVSSSQGKYVFVKFPHKEKLIINPRVCVYLSYLNLCVSQGNCVFVKFPLKEIIINNLRVGVSVRSFDGKACVFLSGYMCLCSNSSQGRIRSMCIPAYK